MAKACDSEGHRFPPLPFLIQQHSSSDRNFPRWVICQMFPLFRRICWQILSYSMLICSCLFYCMERSPTFHEKVFDMSHKTVLYTLPRVILIRFFSKSLTPEHRLFQICLIKNILFMPQTCGKAFLA